MRLLFISSRDVRNKDFGGSQCTNRNYLSFCELTGTENIFVKDLTSDEKSSIKSSIIKRINQIRGFSWGLSNKKINDIIRISKDYDFVFIDTSSYGVIAYYLKRAHYKGKIFCFFHNVEFNIECQKIKFNPFGFLRIPLLYYNEKKACKYSDKVIVLNNRDGAELTKLYKAENIRIIPISLPDSAGDLVSKHTHDVTSRNPTLIFIGNNWYANIHGLNWFIKNVLDHVDIKLQIVGSGLNSLKDSYIHPKIEFLGFVPDLSSVLVNADYVISPIFTGGGMKVKTCESLMYGKNIIGTKEAFAGYDLDYQKAGAICNTKEEFINFIKFNCSIERKKFNEYSRQIFLDKYSFKATLIKFKDLLQN
jgi:hypothetical protein